MAAESYALLATIAASIEDANVAAATKPIAAFAKEYAKQVASDEKAMIAPIDAVIASLPAEVETPRAAGFTVRAAKQVGRNDPCPCGSGLKYKKCCADKPAEREAAPSPIPGVAWDEFLAGDRLAPEHVADLALRDLVRVPVVVDDVRVVDGDVGGALIEVRHRVPARLHHLGDEAVGIADGTRRVVDEARLDLPPVPGEPCALLGRKVPDVELPDALLARRELLRRG
jgi:hypothetical protein